MHRFGSTLQRNLVVGMEDKQKPLVPYSQALKLIDENLVCCRETVQPPHVLDDMRVEDLKSLIFNFTRFNWGQNPELKKYRIGVPRFSLITILSRTTRTCEKV